MVGEPARKGRLQTYPAAVTPWERAKCEYSEFEAEIDGSAGDNGGSCGRYELIWGSALGR